MYQEAEVALQKAQITVQAATFKLPMTLAVCTREVGDEKCCRSEPNSSNNLTSLAMWETWTQSLSGEDPLKKGMATHSSILVWRIPLTEEPGGLQSVGLQRVGHD